MKTPIQTNKAPGAIGPYSQAVVSGDMVYCSGQLGIDPVTGNLSGDVSTEARQALKNVVAVLDAACCTPQDVIKTTIFITNMTNFPKVNEAYAEVFPEPYPARSTVAVAGLPKGGLVEIEVIARIPE